jgi:hypothetical protein
MNAMVGRAFPVCRRPVLSQLELSVNSVLVVVPIEYVANSLAYVKMRIEYNAKSREALLSDFLHGRSFFPSKLWAVKDYAEMVQNVAAQDSDFLIKKQ